MSVSTEQKWQISFLSGLIFLIVSSPMLYKITGNLVKNISDYEIQKKGKPKMSGIMIHTLVFVLITRILMG